jgi:hypothetical protein
MANYNLVVNSKFQPFSFERYIQPLQIYGQAYREIENALGELSANASIWEKLANEQTDKEVYDMYKAYADDLNRSVEDLTKYGLNSSSRRDLLNLRSRYRKEITPIEQAFNLRRQHIDEQRKMRQADNTVEFDMDASTAKLIDYINNPSMTYTPVSKGLVTKRVADAVKNYSNTMLRNPSAWRNTASRQLLERIQQYGLTNADIQEIINNPNAFPEIQKLMSDVVESTGVSNWNKSATLEAVKAAAREGLFAGLGKTIVDVQKNSNYLNDYEQWKWEQEKNAKTPPPDLNLYYRQVPKTTIDKDKETTKLNEDIKTIQEIMNNPSLINKKATRKVTQVEQEYYEPGIQKTTPRRRQIEESYYPYQEKLKEIGKKYDINYSITDGILSENNFADVIKQIDKDIRSSAVRSFSYKPNITQSDLITQVFKENARSYNRMSGKSGLFKVEDNNKGEEIDINDINKYITSDSDIDFDVDLGFVINSTDTKEGTKSAVIDTELIDDPNRTFSKAQESIKLALENGEDELANTLIHALMVSFYNRFNTLVKRQSNTSSK